jgi:hypothetical protein
MKSGFIIAFVLCALFLDAQTDYRDPFLGLYHTNTPPCVNGNEQSPPNHYVRIEKDTLTTTDIFTTDTTVWGSTGYVHHGTLNQSDSTYVDGAVMGKFVQGDSLKIMLPGWVCPPGHIFYLRKIWPVGIYSINNKTISFYLFPNPTVHSFSIVLTGSGGQTELELSDAAGRVLIRSSFQGNSEVSVDRLPRGVYLVRIKGTDYVLTKRLVLTD